MKTFPPEHIANGATRAMARLNSGHGTVEDLAAYRAWITWWRMHGDAEQNLAHALVYADIHAARLGVE